MMERLNKGGFVGVGKKRSFGRSESIDTHKDKSKIVLVSLPGIPPKTKWFI